MEKEIHINHFGGEYGQMERTLSKVFNLERIQEKQ
jgi:hypothetical protein